MQFFHRDDLQDVVVGGLEDHLRGAVGIQRLFPTICTETPLITGLEASKAPVRARRRQIVACGFRELEELFGEQDADGVLAGVVIPCLATSGAIEARHRAGGARCQHLAQNISLRFCHLLLG